MYVGLWSRVEGCRRADLFGLARDWLPPPGIDLDTARARLVRRYLGGFGPSTPAEVADWAGLPVKAVQAVLDRLDLRRFRTDDGQEVFDLPGAPLPDAAPPA